MVVPQYLLTTTLQIFQWFPGRVPVSNPFDEVLEVTGNGSTVLDDRLDFVFHVSSSSGT